MIGTTMELKLHNAGQNDQELVKRFKGKLYWALRGLKDSIEMHNIWFGTFKYISYEETINEICNDYLKDASKRYKNKHFSVDNPDNMEDMYLFFDRKIKWLKKKHSL